MCAKVFYKTYIILYYIIWFEILIIFVSPIPYFISFITCQNFPAIFSSMTLRIFPSSSHPHTKFLITPGISLVPLIYIQRVYNRDSFP